MALTLGRPWALLLWSALAALVVWWARRMPVRSRLAVPLRLALLTLLALGLADPGLPAPSDFAPRVILVDRSASLDPAALDEVKQAIATAGFAPPETIVVQFAEQPQVILDPAGEWPEPIGREQATDLAGALNFAGQLLAGSRGSILLISDGEAPADEALRAAQGLAAVGIRVDTLPVYTAHTTDVSVEAIQMPGSLWAGQPFSVTLDLYALSPVEATVRVSQDGAALAEDELDLPAGETHASFAAQAEAQGLATFEVRVSAPGDARPQNDSRSAVGYVHAPPAVLIAAHHASAEALLRAALVPSGAVVRSVLPADLPLNVDELLPYQVVILEDVSSEALNLEQLKALEAFTYVHGRGLVVIGGPSSYLLGAYESTPLERMLPVRLEPPERIERPAVSLLLIIDHSDSMGEQQAGVSKLTLAKEAAMRAVENLEPTDRVGVLIFDSYQDWPVPLGTLGAGQALRSVLDRISMIKTGSGTDMLTPLRIGIRELAAQPTDRKHIVLLSDGMSSTGTPENFQIAMADAAAANITVSTIAMGQEADKELLSSIADWGRGRFHYAASAEGLPRLLVVESQAVHSAAIQPGTIQPGIARPHPLVSNFASADLPPLSAYIALTARPEADTVLTSPLNDPLLAAWQYGLGRVVAWTSAVDDAWAPAWTGWPDFGRFWTQVVYYALPDSSQGPLFAQAETVGDRVRVTLLAAGADGKGINLAKGHLQIVSPDGAASRVELPQTAPGEYAVTFAAPEPGVYRALASLDKAEQHWETPVGFVVNDAPEFSLRPRSGSVLLRQIASLTGGRIAADVRDAIPTHPARAAPTGPHYGLWLVAAALALWPLEIALRRRWMPWPET